MCEGAMIDASEDENKEILSQSEGEESEDDGKESGEESGMRVERTQ